VNDLAPPPYPADTRAKGWRFELDLERIRQSDTWALAAPDVRPWLFLLWATAWEQVPCGSLPNDDALVCARIGMAPKLFARVKSVLMRGWWPASDGRLYHDVIAARVLSMLDAKRKESDRKAAYRARMDSERAGSAAPVTQTEAVVPRDTTGTDAGQTRADTGCDATGTGTGTGTGTRRREEEIVEASGVVPAVAPDPGTSPAAGAAPTPRGHRLAADWVLPKAWGDWALAEMRGWTAETTRLEAAKFADHWHAKAGKDAAKADWYATWRNWCRNARPTPAGNGRYTPPPMDTAARNAEAKRLLGFDHREVVDV